MSSDDRLRIGVVTAIPTPYRDPFWNAVAAEPGVDLTVYYCASMLSDRPWHPAWEMRYETHIVGGATWWPRRTPARPNTARVSLGERIRRGMHDAIIIGGYNYPTFLSTVLQARRSGIPYYLMSESHLNEARSMWRRVVKRPLVRWVVSGAAGCFPTGRWAREYLIHYGADPDRMWFVPNVPDVAFLDATARELQPQRSALRREKGIGDGPVVLSLGRLVDFKRIDHLIRAFARANVPPAATLSIVGDGVSRPSLEALVEQIGLRDRVRFHGFVEPSEVPRWFAIADLFVLPSVGETWSVALLEALSSGVPVVTTDSVGAAADAIHDPVVGDVVPSGDVEALGVAIENRLAHLPDRETVRRHWAATLDGFRYEAIARRLVEAVRSGRT